MARKSVSVFLVLLLGFASYRPAVCLLSANGLSDGVNPVRNHPRPTRQQSRESTEKQRHLQQAPIPLPKEPKVAASPAPRPEPAPTARRESRPRLEDPCPHLCELPYHHLSPPT